MVRICNVFRIVSLTERGGDQASVLYPSGVYFANSRQNVVSKNEVEVGVVFITIGKALNSNDRWKAKWSVCQEYITALHSIQLTQIKFTGLCSEKEKLN